MTELFILRSGMLRRVEGNLSHDLRFAVSFSSPRQLRELFAMMLMYCEVSEPNVIFERFLPDFAEDFLHRAGVAEVTPAIRNMVLLHLDGIMDKYFFAVSVSSGASGTKRRTLRTLSSFYL